MMDDPFYPQLNEPLEYETQTKVIGVGGGGAVAIEAMMRHFNTDGRWPGVELIHADTDAGALAGGVAHRFIRLGVDAWGPARSKEEGRWAAEHVAGDIRATIEGAQMLFILVVLGGNTGTGAAPVIARLAKEMGVLTVVGVVTEPFDGKAPGNLSGADAGLAELMASADVVVVMRFAKLLESLGAKTPRDAALTFANNAWTNLVRDTALSINVPCHVGVDFEDVRSVLSQAGAAVIGVALARDSDRARVAAEQAVASPLFDGFNLAQVRSALVLISAARGSFRLADSKAAMNTIRASLSPKAHIIYGTTYDDELGDAIRVTVVATEQVQGGDENS